MTWYSCSFGFKKFLTDESFSGNGGLPVEVVRELSMLQLLNGAHPNVMRMVDASLIESEGIPTFVSAGGALTRAILYLALSTLRNV